MHHFPHDVVQSQKTVFWMNVKIRKLFHTKEVYSFEWNQCVDVCRLHVNWWSWREIWSAQRSELRWLRRKSTPVIRCLHQTKNVFISMYVVLANKMQPLPGQHVNFSLAVGEYVPSQQQKWRFCSGVERWWGLLAVLHVMQLDWWWQH